MQKNKKNVLIFIQAIIIIILLFLLFQTNNSQKIVKDNTKSKISEFKIDESISNKNNPRRQVLPDFHALEKEFYMNLKYCTPAELATNTEWEFSIYGYKDNKCVFQERQDFYVMDCNLPTDIMEKYAEDGLKIIYALEDSKRQNKSGMVQSGQYIHEINNNRDFCTRYSVQKKQN